MSSMNTRQRAAHLRKNGLVRSPYKLTRGTTTYVDVANGRGTIWVTIVLGDKDGGSNFMIRAPHMGLTSSFIGVDNLREGFAAQIREWGRDYPDPDAPDVGSPEWIGELFRAAVAHAMEEPG